jgi:hypothetical protein
MQNVMRNSRKPLFEERGDILEHVILKGDQGHIEITFREIFGFPSQTSHAGGYDVCGDISIISRGYKVFSEVYFSTGELYLFYRELLKSYEIVSGKASLINFEKTLQITCEFRPRGHVEISGYFIERYDIDNELKFSFLSDQSYIKATLNLLNEIIEKYGDLKGIR